MKNVVLSSKRIGIYDSAQAAGSTTLTSGVIDMQDFDTAVFMALIGALTAGQTKGTLQVFAGNASNGSDAALLGGASITIQDADTGKWEILEVVKPVGFRYLELVITRNSQACAVTAAMVELHAAHKQPTSDDATTVAQTMVVIDPDYVNSQLSVTPTTYPGSTTQVVSTYRSQS